MLLIVLTQWSHFLVSWPALQSLPENQMYRLAIRILYLACMTTLYAVEALFFTYGELRSTTAEDAH